MPGTAWVVGSVWVVMAVCPSTRDRKYACQCVWVSHVCVSV